MFENIVFLQKYSTMIEIINSIRKYNFWNNNTIDIGYPRTFYTDKIGQYKGNVWMITKYPPMKESNIYLRGSWKII